MVSLLDRLGHSRVLARLGGPAPAKPAADASTRGYLHERGSWSLRPREPGRAARSLTEPISERPRMLGGALDRLVLPDAESLARALGLLGVGAWLFVDDPDARRLATVAGTIVVVPKADGWVASVRF